MKRKQWIAFLGMVSVVLIFAACGGDSGNNSTEPEGDSSSSTARFSSSSIGVSSSLLLVSSSSANEPSSSSIALSSSVEKFSSSSVVKFSSSSVEELSSSSSSSVTKDWFNAAISYGSLTDTRDNQTYKTVVIGTQTWMAENLNFDTLDGTGSWCYYNLASDCAIYGRLYNWNTVMAGSASSSATPSGVHGICPTGWHVPSDAEWTKLTDYVGGANTAGTKLKANSSLWLNNTGTDAYGFSALPGGYHNGSGFSNGEGSGSWWSATAYSSTNAYYQHMYYAYTTVYSTDRDKSYGFSLRCVMN